MALDTPTPWLTRIEAAQHLKVTVATLEKWAVRGGGPPYSKPRGGAIVRYNREALDNWMLAQTRLHSADDGSATRRIAKAKET